MVSGVHRMCLERAEILSSSLPGEVAALGSICNDDDDDGYLILVHLAVSNMLDS